MNNSRQFRSQEFELIEGSPFVASEIFQRLGAINRVAPLQERNHLGNAGTYRPGPIYGVCGEGELDGSCGSILD